MKNKNKNKLKKYPLVFKYAGPNLTWFGSVIFSVFFIVIMFFEIGGFKDGPPEDEVIPFYLIFFSFPLVGYVMGWLMNENEKEGEPKTEWSVKDLKESPLIDVKVLNKWKRKNKKKEFATKTEFAEMCEETWKIKHEIFDKMFESRK